MFYEVVANFHRLVGLSPLLDDKCLGCPGVSWQRTTVVFQGNSAALGDVDIPGSALIMMHNGPFDECFPVEELLKPHPRAFRHVSEHERVKRTSVRVGRPLRPLSLRHLSENRGVEQE